jgi:hypothetical protein
MRRRHGNKKYSTLEQGKFGVILVFGKTHKTNISINQQNEDKQEKLAGKLNLIVKDYSELHLGAKSRCFVVVTTGAKSYADRKQFKSKKNFIDFGFIHT